MCGLASKPALSFLFAFPQQQTVIWDYKSFLFWVALGLNILSQQEKGNHNTYPAGRHCPVS